MSWLVSPSSLALQCFSCCRSAAVSSFVWSYWNIGSKLPSATMVSDLGLHSLCSRIGDAC
eukprot:7765572-Lingulodinium_polyedra.AAC.1